MMTRCQTATYAILMVSMALAWLLALGGVGRLSAMSYRAAVSYADPSKQASKDTGTDWESVMSVQQTYRNAFWIIFFQLVIYVGLIVALARPQGVPQYRIVLVAFLTVVCTQTMTLANEYLDLWNTCNYWNAQTPSSTTCGDDVAMAYSAAAAGYVLLCTLDFIWILICGAMEDPTVLRNGGNGDYADAADETLDKQNSIEGAEPASGRV
ncbi:unnamed protein product [Phaeothamnion confervicola]